ncbi:MAG: UDP-N-acetylglucosamine 1-carboxyvinyltransferase, partial [Clostridia bacterium]
MERIVIHGGKKLSGSIEVSGMKNAALPIIFSTILVEDKCIIENVPSISDVSIALEIMSAMGANIRMLDKTTLEIDTRRVRCGTAPYDLARSMRGSYYILGAELGRFGTACVACPGGCDFGVRPIDLHIKGFESLGASVEIENGSVHCYAPNGLTSSSVYLDIESVGATINIVIAAV